MNISLARDYRSLNSYQKTRIVEFYYKNKDIQVKDIGKELNISDRAVRRVLKEENINTRLKNKFGAVKARTPEQLLQSKKYIETIITELEKMI